MGITELAGQPLEGSRDSIAASEDSEETVDSPTSVNREGGEKCRKCSRSGWRARHASFCSECQSQDEEKLRKKCEKCSRKGFAFRNIDFCETSCGGEKAENEETEQVTTGKPTRDREALTEESTSLTSEQVTERAEESTTLMMTTVQEDGKKRRGGEVRSQNRCKRCQKRGFYKRNAAFCDGTCDILLLDKKIIHDEAESNQKEASKARKEERRKNKIKKRKESKGNLEDKLGPLEELIKYLIQKNHGSRE